MSSYDESIETQYKDNETKQIERLKVSLRFLDPKTTNVEITAGSYRFNVTGSRFPIYIYFQIKRLCEKVLDTSFIEALRKIIVSENENTTEVALNDQFPPVVSDKEGYTVTGDDKNFNFDSALLACNIKSPRSTTSFFNIVPIQTNETNYKNIFQAFNLNTEDKKTEFDFITAFLP